MISAESADPVRLTVRAVSVAPAAAIALVGDLEYGTVSQLVDEASRILQSPCDSIVLDVSGLDFCDSSGIGALVRLRETASAMGVRFRLHQPSERLTSRLSMMGIVGLFPELEG